jgi:tellurite resistance protein TehA-like permease
MPNSESTPTRQRYPRSLERILAVIPPASGAVVMGTGIVSVALLLDGRETVSRILLAVALVVWVALGMILVGRLTRDRARFRLESRSPAALTGVAGTAVLGTRLVLLGWGWAGIALLAIALAFWLGLVGTVLRNWVVPTVGASFILTVSTESLALLAATLALDEHAHWLLAVSLVPFALGLAFYLFVLARFDLHQLAIGRGDHWVSGGALAISTVVAGTITIDAKALGMFDTHQTMLRGVTLGLWILTMLWLPALLVAETRYRRLNYDVRRWSTVFPVGMYAACSFTVGDASGAPPITDFARAWVWVAVSVWLVTFAAMLRRGPQLARGES